MSTVLAARRCAAIVTSAVHVLRRRAATFEKLDIKPALRRITGGLLLSAGGLQCDNPGVQPTRDAASNQLSDWAMANGHNQQRLTTSSGAPIGDKNNVMTVGPRGPMLVKDFVFADENAHFNAERIPERVVHAKGSGAFGYFEVTHDITRYTKASVFSCVGKRTDTAVRFSTVGGERGSADTVRDPRGFAVKFYTDEGNWDITGNNTPIFFIRDPILFPSFIHTQKRNPATNLPDADAFWDFQSLRPETVHQMMILFSDRGIPDGYRHMDGFGSHTFKLVNAKGEAFYCKFHFKCNQGIRNLPVKTAQYLAGTDPDYAQRDIYNSIACNKCPSWTFCIQVMTFEEAEKCKFNPFDVTKIWPHKDYPLIPVGKLVLNRNPKNYHAEVEQMAFSPAHLVPGIEPSPDKMLQGRMFSYSDTHRHRLGANHQQIPVNCPYKTRVANYQRDGEATIVPSGHGTDAPNYFPNSFGGPTDCSSYLEHRESLSGDVTRHDSGDEDNFSQAADFWNNVLGPEERCRLVENIAAHLRKAQPCIQCRAVANFDKVSSEMGQMLRSKLAL